MFLFNIQPIEGAGKGLQGAFGIPNVLNERVGHVDLEQILDQFSDKRRVHFVSKEPLARTWVFDAGIFGLEVRVAFPFHRKFICLQIRFTLSVNSGVTLGPSSEWLWMRSRMASRMLLSSS